MRIVAASLLLLVACGGETVPGMPSELVGVVIAIESSGIDDVTAFTLRSEGETYEIAIDPSRNYGFPLGHLGAHRTSGDPVRVTLEEREGRLVATSILDAESEPP